jgi:hypothetical protein
MLTRRKKRRKSKRKRRGVITRCSSKDSLMLSRKEALNSNKIVSKVSKMAELLVPILLSYLYKK